MCSSDLFPSHDISVTVQSESYPLEIAKLHKEIVVSSEACPLWVPLIENNEHDSEGADYFIQKNIHNLLKKMRKLIR